MSKKAEKMHRVNTEGLASLVRVSFTSMVPLMIWSSPGIGKSSIVNQQAAAMGWPVIDVRASQMDPVDFRGVPFVLDQQTKWAVPEFLPTANQPAVLFLDEITQAAVATKAALFQLVLDRRLGDYVLPDEVRIIMAGNYQSDKAGSHGMPTALSNRVFHAHVEASIDPWSKWAMANGIDHRIIAFLKWKPDMLHAFDPRSASTAFSSPRSWEMLHKVLAAGPERSVLQEAMSGVVGDGAAIECASFIKKCDQLPTREEVLANPKKAKVPDNDAVDAQHGIVCSLAAFADSDNLGKLLTYAERLPTEFGASFLDMVFSRDPNIGDNCPEFKDWAVKHAHLFGINASS